MTVFILMLAATTLFAIHSTAQLLRGRFLHPTSLAVLSTFYYGVPLAVCGYFMYNPRLMIFLHPAAADPAIAMRSLAYVLAAILALYGGTYAVKALQPRGPGTYFEITEVGYSRVWLATLAMIVMVAGGILQFGIAEFFDGYATESDAKGATLGIALVYFSVSSFGLIIAYALIIRQEMPDKPVWALIAICVLCALFVLLVRAKRLEVVTTFLPVIVILLARRQRLAIAFGRLALGAIVLALLVVVAIVRIDDQFDLFTVNFYLLSEGLYAGHSLPGIIQRLDAGMLPYEHGVRFLSALLAFVPRFVWAGKDDFVYAGNFALDGVSPLGATSFLAEVVLQGGLVAVALVYFLLGMVFEWSTRFESVWDAALATGKNPGRFIPYLVLVSVFIPHFRDGIIPAIKLSLQAGALFVLLTGLHRVPAWIRERRARPVDWAGGMA